MKYAKVHKWDAQKAKLELRRIGVLDPNHLVFREGDYVFFPVTSDLGLDYAQLVECEGGLKHRRAHSIGEALSSLLPPGELSMLPSSYNVVGDICVLELPDELLHRKDLIGEVILDTFPHVKVVCLKTQMVSGTFRTPGVKVIAGEKRTQTVHREFGCRYLLDVSNSYFSPRLGGERMRLASQVRSSERVLVMFAGVGPYAVLCAKRSGAEVVACELNPHAVNYMRENVLMNKVDVEVVEGDVRRVTPELGFFDRIVMPLPKLADTFLDVAVKVLNPGGVIHFYCFARNSLEATAKLSETLGGLGYRPDILSALECGSYSPCMSRYCVDFKLVRL